MEEGRRNQEELLEEGRSKKEEAKRKEREKIPRRKKEERGRSRRRFEETMTSHDTKLNVNLSRDPPSWNLLVPCSPGKKEKSESLSLSLTLSHKFKSVRQKLKEEEIEFLEEFRRAAGRLLKLFSCLRLSYSVCIV